MDINHRGKKTDTLFLKWFLGADFTRLDIFKQDVLNGGMLNHAMILEAPATLGDLCYKHQQSGVITNGSFLLGQSKIIINGI